MTRKPTRERHRRMRRTVTSISLGGAALGGAALALGIGVLGCPLTPFPLPFEADAGADAADAAVIDAPACFADADCDDHDPCTVDRCAAGVCSSTLAAMGSDCSDGDPCNGAETCDALGQCSAGPAPITDDGDPCTADGCDPATGQVSHTKLPTCGWSPTSSTGAPLPRERHTALWTGTRMIVWGGSAAGSPPVTATGGVYDPSNDTWTATASAGAPPPRHSHRAVWTGSKMIVWGGFGATDYETTGGVYDPAAGAWTPMSTAGAPGGRTEFAAAWTGQVFVVWGGQRNGAALGDGGIYDPAADAWTAVPGGGLSPRFGHSMVWTGSSVVVWGGNDLFDWHQDGRLLGADPPAAWGQPTSLTGAPERREAHTALWTGSKLLVWGGWNGGPYLNSGGVFDPAAGAMGAWTATSTTGAPSPRSEHSAVWTGQKMLIWGGCGDDACKTNLGDGGEWTADASGGAWVTIAADPALSARKRHTAVWTGTEVVVWGGRDDDGLSGTGARLVPP